MGNKSIDKSKQYHLNPRKISDKELNRLEDHLLKFGDLGGVVYCRNNKAYVGGNQRSKIFDGAEIIITEEYHLPQKDKTVAVGVIQWNDRQYSYREVVFTEEEFNNFPDVNLFKDEEGNPLRVRIYPNPVSDILHVEYTLEINTPVNIIMATIDGKVVKNIFRKQQQAGDQHEEIDCSMLLSGAYLLKIKAGDKVVNGKILKK